MPDDLVTIATFEFPHEAHAARSRLAAAGISSQISDENTVSALAIVGTALGGVKLLVWKSDLEKAGELLFPDESEEEQDDVRHTRPRRAWKCPRCQEPNEPAFDLCWSCGAPWSPAAKEASDETVARESDSARDASASFTDDDYGMDHPTGIAPEQADNPYAPGRFAATGNPAEEAEVSADPEVMATITRAWRAAIIGLVVCPVVLQFYSMWLLVCASSSGKSFDASANRWFYATLAVDVGFLAVVGAAFWSSYLSW